jgi:predicted acylesterase/phospholipase RssA
MPLNENDIPNKQRALVLQGGGALGAYEAGVLTVLCKELTGNNCNFLILRFQIFVLM